MARREDKDTYKLRKIADGFEGLTHGKISTYSIGCRCDPCRDANRRYKATNINQQAHSIAQRRIQTWAVRTYPAKYAELVEEAKDGLTH